MKSTSSFLPSSIITNGTTAILFFISLAFSLYAADDELTQLRQRYESALDRAAAPLKAAYIAELQKLLERQTKTGDLDGALATRAEMEAFSKSSTSPTSTPSRSEVSREDILNSGGSPNPIAKKGTKLSSQELKEIEKRFVGRLWADALREHHTFYFRGNGTATRVIDSRVGKKQDFKWVLRNDGLVVCGDRCFRFEADDQAQWYVPIGASIEVTNLVPIIDGKDPDK